MLGGRHYCWWSLQLFKNNTKNYLNITINLMMSTMQKVNVKVSQGTVIGTTETLPNGESFYIFSGIPYAKPPIGNLRFKPPVPIDKFTEDPLDCTEERDVCTHKDLVSSSIIGSEDCLFLNIYTPAQLTTTIINKKNDDSKQRKKPQPLMPVMLWIHGGGYMQGSGNRSFYSPEYIIQEGVIVVTINYRIGALGFLYLPKAGIHGNAGIKDQFEALKWVHSNIAEFGGDPNNITLFGESAGGCSVQLLALSDKSKNYFHKAISESGSSIMDWVWQLFPEEKARKLGKLTGCEKTNDKEILDHLLTVPSEDLVTKAFHTLEDVEKWQGTPIPFKVVVEKDGPDALVTKHSVDALQKPNVLQIPFLTGYNSCEGIVLVPIFTKKIHEFEKNLQYTLPRTLNITAGSFTAQALAKEVKQFYFGDKPITLESIPIIADMQTDYYFTIPSIVNAELHVKHQPNSPLYFYRFSFDGDLNLLKKFFRIKIKGATHGDEMFYLFDMKIAGVNVPENSRSGKLRQKMCKMWTNFAKYGNPTPEPTELLPVKWEPVTYDKMSVNQQSSIDVNYLEIDDEFKMKVNPEPDRIRFWRKIFQTWNGSILKPKF